MRKSTLSLLIVVVAALLIGSSGLLWAQTSDISDILGVTLDFNKSYYVCGEPVNVTVTVSNKSGKDLYVSEGFKAKEYYLEMRVIDPAGRLVLAKRLGEHEEFPDAPPLPFCRKNDGSFTQVAPHEILPAGWTSEPSQSQTLDLRDYFPFKFPGNYSFQVQLSAMIWDPPDGEPCIGDINAYKSLGVAKSETKYVQTQGSTKVKVIPQKWPISWEKNQDYPRPELSVIIVPEKGKTITDYSMDYIQLNNVKADMVFKQYSPLYRIYYLRAFFDRQKAINSLGEVQAGNIYRVVISGTMKDGGFFGGGAQIKVINY